MPEQAMQLPAYLLLSDNSFTGLRYDVAMWPSHPETRSKQCALSFTEGNPIGVGSLGPRFSTLVHLGETYTFEPWAKGEAHPGDKFDCHTNTL